VAPSAPCRSGITIAKASRKGHLAQVAEPLGGDESHFQDEERQRPLESTLEERGHRHPALFAHQEADRESADEEDHRAPGEDVVQGLAHRAPAGPAIEPKDTWLSSTPPFNPRAKSR
jgi:hypothetical protein